MTRFPEPGRQAGHVLLDATSIALADPTAADATNLAFQRLMQIDGAIVVHVDDPGPGQELDVNLDLSNLLGPTLVALHWSISRIAELEGRSPQEVTFELREYLDS